MSVPATPILVPTLAELSIELEKAIASYRAAEAAWDAYPHPGPSREDLVNVQFDAATRACIDIAAQIAELPAQSLADLRIKARALSFGGSYLNDKGEMMDDKLVAQIVSGLLNERIC